MSLLSLDSCSGVGPRDDISDILRVAIEGIWINDCDKSSDSLIHKSPCCSPTVSSESTCHAGAAEVREPPNVGPPRYF